MRRHLSFLAVIFGAILLVLFLGNGLRYSAAQQTTAPVAGGTVAFSPDGKTLAGGSKTGMIALWNLKTGKRIRTLGGEPGLPVTGLIFSPDGSILTSVGRDSEVHRWDVATGEPGPTLTAHQAAIRAVAATPDGNTVASGGEDTRIALWDATAGKLKNVLAGHFNFVNGLAFSPDGQTLASGAEDAQIILWDAATGSRRQTLLGHAAGVTRVAFSPDGSILASAGKDGSVRIWDAATGEQRGVLAGPTQSVRALAFSADGMTLIGGGDDRRLFTWDVTTGRLLKALPATRNPVIGLALDPDGRTLAIGDEAGNAVIIDLTTGQRRRLFQAPSGADAGEGDSPEGLDSPVAEKAGPAGEPAGSEAASGQSDKPAPVTTAEATEALAAPQAPVSNFATSIAFSTDGATLAAALKSGAVNLSNPNSGQAKGTLRGHDNLPATAVAFQPDGRLLSGGRDSTARRWDVSTTAQLQLLSGHEEAVRTVAVSRDGGRAASGGEDTRVAVWRGATGELERILEGHIGFVNGLAFSRDGQILASGSDDARIFLWNAATGERRAVLLGHGAAVTSVAFSPVANILASASADGTVRLWDAVSGQQSIILRGPTKKISSVAFSPDGTTLIGGGDDGFTFTWDVATGSPRGPLRGNRGPVTSVAFSPDGSTIGSADDSGQIVLFNAATGAVRRIIPVPAAAVAKQAPPARTAPQSEQAAAPSALPAPPGGPILIIAANPYSNFYSEILLNEGLNAFDVTTTVPGDLVGYDVVILAAPLTTAAQVTMFQNWVTAGGNLIAMRPSSNLAPLLGLTAVGSTRSDAYLLVDTSRWPGNGIVGQTMQYHGTADRYTLNGATRLATLYSNATTPTANPAVTLRTVGTGRAAAFTYDLARSIVQTRQGNPAWAGQERDTFSPIRSDDLYFGNTQADWVNLNKVAIPQADEQQRLLANLIIQMNLNKKPLPRFWYFPDTPLQSTPTKAVVVMTGDDHANGATAGRFDQYKTMRPGCSVANWGCVRGTSYVYPNTPLTNAQAAAYNNDGFEVGLHINTNCGDFTPTSLASFYSQQISDWRAKYSSLPPPLTQRHHCIAWSDWVTGAKVQVNHGIRLDTNYYYWPPGWVQNRPGFFTGSGMPMRFLDSANGTLIDNYQAETQMTDESGQSYPFTINTLLDRALGAEGYYGAFVVNAHTDFNPSSVSDAVVNSALARNVPVVSARQMLTWLDGRNGSKFGSLSWSTGGNTLSFTISRGPGANNLVAMLPRNSGNGVLTQITSNQGVVNHTVRSIKGIEYALFAGQAGSYIATYGSDTVAPSVTARIPAPGATGVSVGATVTATFSEEMDSSTINGTTFKLLAGSTAVPATVTYDSGSRSAILRPNAMLAYNTSYTAQVVGGASGVKDLAGNPLAANQTWSFQTSSMPCAAQACSIWNTSAVPANPSVSDPNAVELGVKFTSEVDGFITGIRFYKGPNNTGTHTGTIWSAAGQSLRSGTFSNESASGWQTLTFSTPLAISANTVYVASYHTDVGNYAANNDFFATSGVDNPPLHALRDGVSGGNGVYQYGARAFPTNSWRSSNYWVDVLFKTQ